MTNIIFTKRKIFYFCLWSMKHLINIIGILAVITFAACTDGDIKPKHAPQPSDTLYTEKAVMDVYATQPERALLIIDSAMIVGNLTELRGDLLKALVYSRTDEDMKYDSAILIGERLMHREEVNADPASKEDVLGILLDACRMIKDYEQALHWAAQLSDLYRSQGEETEALRTDAEMGSFMVRIGQQEAGLSLIDHVAAQLTAAGNMKFNELDAMIVVLKRKAELCNEIGLYDDVIPATQRMLDLLDDYEKRPLYYHDGTYREPDDDDRPGYIDFYRGKTYAYIAIAKANLGFREESLDYLKLYEQTAAGQSVTGRFMIAPTLGELGAYDKMLTIYDEVEQLLGTDTLNANYAEILYGRAKAAYAQGRKDEAFGYWERHDAIQEYLNDRLLHSKAHLYAARFHAQEQEREIERHREATRRATMIGLSISIVGLLILLFAVYAVIQWRKMQRSNHFLAQQITESVEYKEKYKELVESEKLKEKSKLPSTPSSNLSALSDVELFAYLRDLIEQEKLFLDPNFERQTLIERTGLSKERIGAAFAQGSDHERLTTLIRELRLDYAVRLMNERPELSIEQVCQASGFTKADTFTRNFRAKYGMTPTTYRNTKA